MTYTKLSVKLALFTAVSALTHTASAQAAPAGSQKLQLSAFVPQSYMARNQLTQAGRINVCHSGEA